MTVPTAASLHVDDIWTGLGISEGAQHLGAFSGSTIADNQTVKAAIQALETAVEGKAAVNASTTGSAGSLKSPATTGLTTITGPGAGQTRNVTIPDANLTIGTLTENKLCLGTATGFNCNNDSLSISTISPTTLNLPSTNADPATTAGQIRHDSTDTDASAGGILEWWDGTNTRRVVDIAAVAAANYTVVTKEEYLPIRYAEDDDSVTAPGAAAEIGTTTMIGRSFVEDADNGVVFWWKVPSDYVGGIKYRVTYAIQTTAGADETVAFALSGCSVGDSDGIACAEGTAINVTDELSDAYVGDTDVIITGWSTEVTVTNIAAGEMAKLLFIRDVSEDDYDDADDNVKVVGIEIKYKARIFGVDAY